MDDALTGWPDDVCPVAARETPSSASSRTLEIRSSGPYSPDSMRRTIRSAICLHLGTRGFQSISRT